MHHITTLGDMPADQLDWDVCIIGTGPAGATLACELSDTGLRVLLLESGGLVRQPHADALNEVENVGWPRVADQWLVRNRIVGGSSHTWSGRCVPFDDIDFEKRSWVPYSGWPLVSGALTRYLERAESYLGLNAGSGLTSDAFWTLAGRARPIPEFDETRLIPHLWQFSRDHENRREHTRFAHVLTRNLADNVTLLSNATVCDIELNEACSAVRAVQVAAPDGARWRISARQVILCAGGIENPRLLLSADTQLPGGIGNQYGQVGRYLMDHLRGPTASFSLHCTDRLRKQLGHYRVSGGQVFALGLRLSPVLQKQEELLNCSAWLEGNIAADDPWNALKQIAKGDIRVSTFAAITGNAGLLARGMRDHLVERNGLPRKIDRLNLICMCEQLPDPESQVTLSHERDGLGMRRTRVNWRVHEQEARTMRRMTALIAGQFARLRWPVPQPDAWLATDAPLPQYFQDVAHPTGTTRMGDDLRTSVVDKNCQLHGVSGLYVAGSSVFPTSSHANPTHMIVALALRLADTIRARASVLTPA